MEVKINFDTNEHGPMYPIKAVALKTGLTTHTIRVWERRYGIINPQRTESNRRLYSEEDVETLLLLKRATQAGHSIGQLSKLSKDALENLVREQQIIRKPSKDTMMKRDGSPDTYVKSAIDAAMHFNNDELETILTEASVNFSQPVLVDRVVIPILHELGDQWFSGELRIAQEHGASATLRTFLGRLLNTIIVPDNAPLVVTATVAGLFHEFGALLAAISAASQGWRAKYLGPNLPAEEIAYAVREMNAKVVVISIIYPPADKGVIEQFKHLHRLLPEDVKILVGGYSADSYRETLDAINATHLDRKSVV